MNTLLRSSLLFGSRSILRQYAGTSPMISRQLGPGPPRASGRPLSLQTYSRLWPLKVASSNANGAYAVSARGCKPWVQKPGDRAVSARNISSSGMHRVAAVRIEIPAHENNDQDVLAGLRSDWRTVKETFMIREVPKEVLYMGLAGLVPYVVTSWSTLFLAWDVNYAHSHVTGHVFSQITAENMLHILEPLQVGYGAVIISFLGAIHWGLEFAEYGGKRSYRRYAIGLMAPALAWPTLLLPLHSALLAQFLGFSAMYWVDASASTAGLVPPWYPTYRFVLTFVVGASIILTLIGRGQIEEQFIHSPPAAEHLQQLRETQREHAQDTARKAAIERTRRRETFERSEEVGSDGAVQREGGGGEEEEEEKEKEEEDQEESAGRNPVSAEELKDEQTDAVQPKFGGNKEDQEEDPIQPKSGAKPSSFKQYVGELASRMSPFGRK